MVAGCRQGEPRGALQYQLRDDGGLGSRCTAEDGKTSSESGPIFELDTARLANRLDVGGKERACKEPS